MTARPRRLALALLLAGCGGPEGLSGSLGESWSLDYDEVTVQRDANSLAVTYQRTQGESLGTVLRLGIDLTDLDLGGPPRIDLAGRLANGMPRVTVTRALNDEEPPLFAGIARGELTLDATPEDGHYVNGSFRLAFVQASRDEAAGRTVSGEIHALVRDVGPTSRSALSSDPEQDSGLVGAAFGCQAVPGPIAGGWLGVLVALGLAARRRD